MVSNELTQSVLALPEADRLELARRLIESVQIADEVALPLAEGIQRIEDIAAGRVAGLTSGEFDAKLR